MPRTPSFSADRLLRCHSVTGRSAVRLSAERGKYGTRSLRWDWFPGGALTFHHPIPFLPSRPREDAHALSTFAVWIYNPAARPRERLRFEFCRAGVCACWFDFGLDFTGWRTCWVPYERDMRGKPRVDLDALRLVPPAAAKGGTFFLGSLVWAQPVDPRYPTRDRQVPFVGTCRPGDANDHWQGLCRFAQNRPPRPPSARLSAQDRSDFRAIEKRLEEMAGLGRELPPPSLAALRRRYAAFRIERTPAGIRGRPIAYREEADIYPVGSPERRAIGREGNLESCSQLLLGLAQFCRAGQPAARPEARGLFFLLLEHLRDQGWVEGSAMGTVHHLGYSNGGYYLGLFLMRAELKAAGLLEAVRRDMAWFSGAGRAFGPLRKVNGVSLDTLHTTLPGQLLSLLIREDSPEKAAELYRTSQWLGRALEPCQGLNGGIKADGAMIHHCNHYPAYAVGALKGAALALYALSGTRFRVPAAGHASLRRAMLALRFSANVLDWPLSLSGRHPNGKWRIDASAYRLAALAGAPGGGADGEMMSAYLRLAAADSGERPFAASGAAAGFRAEAPPSGHLTINYATLSAHRRGAWLATARGFSRYLWGSEVYRRANLFGRTLAYGHVEILARGEPINLFDNGFGPEGWDWNGWPGTTARHLPLTQLRDRARHLDAMSGEEEMLVSDETFAGGSSLEGSQGLFAFKLHEHAKYDASHRARKSVFFFEDRLVLLGSGIRNRDSVHGTRTTLFQNRRRRGETVYLADGPPLASLPSEHRQPAGGPTWLMDLAGNGYWLADGRNLRATLRTQHSLGQTDARPTKGDFALAWLDHGRAPRGGAYHYAILVQSDVGKMAEFSTAMSRPGSEPYLVQQHDDRAHIVRDRATGVTAAAFFEPAPATPESCEVAAVDTPSLVMTRTTARGLHLSVCNPDLRLYDGVEADQLNPDGTQREVSLYSRSWIHRGGRPTAVRIVLRGAYRLTVPVPGVKIERSGKDRTRVLFTCRDGIPLEVTLKLQMPLP